jgi:hypothetical protein
MVIGFSGVPAGYFLITNNQSRLTEFDEPRQIPKKRGQICLSPLTLANKTGRIPPKAKRRLVIFRRNKHDAPLNQEFYEEADFYREIQG